MGFFDRLRAKRAYGRVSSKSDIGVDIAEKKVQAKLDKKVNKRDDIFESKEERAERIRNRISPETKAKVRRGLKTAAKHYRQFQKETGFGEQPQNSDPMGLGDMFGSSEGRGMTGEDMLGGGEDIFGGGPPRRSKRNSDWDWMR